MNLGFFYQRFSSPIATKPISSETRKAERWSVANHGSIGDSCLWLFRGCPRGPRVGCETRCPRRTVPNLPAETPLSNPSVSKNRQPPPEKIPTMERINRRHSSCLWIQILGVETYLLLPDMQGDRRDLPRQRQACHLWPDAFGQQCGVELLKRTGLCERRRSPQP